MKSSPKLKPGVWVSIIYYAQGLPFSIVRQVSVVFFQDLGAKLSTLGLTSLYGIPWTFKFLWAPLVDKFSTKRRWLLAMEVGLFSILAVVCLFTQMKANLQVMAALFLVIAILSATHDI